MNMSGLDTNVFPNLSAYINALPVGLDSYPEAKTKALYSLLLRDSMKAELTSTSLPYPLRTRLLADWKPDDWIPAALYAALAALAKDMKWKSETAFHQGMADLAVSMYQTAVYRAVMAIVSPSLMVMGAARRWGTFHQGTQLRVVNPTKTSGDAVLTFPDRLFSQPALQSLGASLCTALTGCGAKNVTLVLRNVKQSEATLHFEWQF